MLQTERKRETGREKYKEREIERDLTDRTKKIDKLRL